MSFSTLISRLSLGLALSAAALATQAQTYQFTLNGSYTASWAMDAAPVPDEYFGGVGFVMDNISGSFPGAAGLVDIGFFQASMGGGLSIYDFVGDNYLLISDGPQLYTGSETAPVFALGSFSLTAYGGSGEAYTLTITDPAAVPEPASVALLLAGLGVVAGVARRRSSSTAAA